MWKSKELLKKEAADLLFPVAERLKMNGLLKHYDIVITWEPEEDEALIGFMGAGEIRELIAGLEALKQDEDPK